MFCFQRYILPSHSCCVFSPQSLFPKQIFNTNKWIKGENRGTFNSIFTFRFFVSFSILQKLFEVKKMLSYAYPISVKQHNESFKIELKMTKFLPLAYMCTFLSNKQMFSFSPFFPIHSHFYTVGPFGNIITYTYIEIEFRLFWGLYHSLFGFPFTRKFVLFLIFIHILLCVHMI